MSYRPDLRFVVNADASPLGALPSLKTALEAFEDSTALRANYSLLISAFDFVTALREIALSAYPNGVCRVKAIAPGGYDLMMYPPAERRRVRHSGGDGCELAVTLPSLGEPILHAYVCFDEDKDVFEARRLHFVVNYWGAHEIVGAVAREMRERFGQSRLASVQWWYQGDHGSECRNITMQPPPPIHDSFYPWLGEPVASYFARYLDDSASVLFIMGEAGTGKTSLLRHFIYENQLTALVTYEEKLLNSDEMFVHFLAMGDDAVMIIEDAESLVHVRDEGGGGLMTRFLNVSDGLVHLAKRKIVFTTNQNDFRGVDPALIRPGRCFGAIKARALTHEEACVAAQDAGLPPPEETGRPIVLADLFNPPQPQSVERIGIGVGR
jgi:hypothetical protein